MWKKFIEMILYPVVYLRTQQSLLRQQEQNSFFEIVSEMNSQQMEVFQKMQDSNAQMLAEVVKTSAASSEVLKSWLDGFKSVEVPKAVEFHKDEAEELEKLKEEYRMNNPDTFELAEMTKGLLENFRFEQ